MGGTPLAGVLVYAPALASLTVTDKAGNGSIPGVAQANSTVILNFRSSQLENSGFDLPAKDGASLSIAAARKRDYNPQRCPEVDQLMNLYEAGVRIRKLYLMAQSDSKLLANSLASKRDNKDAYSAFERVRFHTQAYYNLSALMPDRELTCSTPQPACSAINLRATRRSMAQFATFLRLDNLFLNRHLRIEGSRNVASSKKRVKQIRSVHERIIARIRKLPRVSFTCPTSTKTTP